MTRTRGGALMVAGIVLLALNLRPVAGSVGPVLDDLRADLGLGAGGAGLLTSLPVLAFASVGALAPRLAARVGRHRLTALALLVVALGALLRATVDTAPAFLAWSFVALGGMAAANVVLPSLVKQHFPDRVGPLTAVYSTGLAIGVTAAAALTVPVADTAGGADGWREGLGIWGLLALLALAPWLWLARLDGRGAPAQAAGGGEAGAAVPLGAIARTRTGWLMAVTFGLQALQAYAIFGWVPAVYRDAGYTDAQAGGYMGLVTGISIPLSLLVPLATARWYDLRPLMLGLTVCYPIAYSGLAFAPTAAPVVWALVVGAATCTFPLILTLIGLRARTPGGTAALSGFTQSVGYLIASIGPFGVGVLHDATGGWQVPLMVLSALAVPLALGSVALSRPRHVEDELPAAVRAGVTGSG